MKHCPSPPVSSLELTSFVVVEVNLAFFLSSMLGKHTINAQVATQILTSRGAPLRLMPKDMWWTMHGVTVLTAVQEHVRQLIPSPSNPNDATEHAVL